MKISVIIPTFNRLHQIGRAIESVLLQESVDLELIVIDDGSTDGTPEQLPKHYPDPRLRVLQNSRAKGPAGARNTGILAATGELIAFLDSDDCFLPNHLSESLGVFLRFPEVGVVFGRAEYEQDGRAVDYMGPNFDRKIAQADTLHSGTAERVFSDTFFTHLLKYGCYFNLSSVVLKTEAARLLMNEALRIAEDYEFWVRLSRQYRFACLNGPQISYLLHEQNISFEQSASVADNAPRLIQAYNIMLNYDDLMPDQSALIRGHMAEVLFDWGYRCRQHKQPAEAFRLHWRSFQFGLRSKNLIAVLKLLILVLVPKSARP